MSLCHNLRPVTSDRPDVSGESNDVWREAKNRRSDTTRDRDSSETVEDEDTSEESGE